MLESLPTVKGRGRSTRAHVALAGAILALVTAASSPAASPAPPFAAGDAARDVDYTPGRGFRLGNTGVHLGGYTNVSVARDEGKRAQLTLDDLSLFVTWAPVPRLHFFSELEFGDLVRIDDHGHGDNRDYAFTAERLYGDLAISDALNFRLGKFLTPVGRWNVIHAQPLVWTTSRPLVTELPFDEHTTGAMAFGAFFPATSILTYELYGQFTEQLDRLDRLETAMPADRSGGGRLTWTASSGWSLGASYLAAEHRDTWRHLSGLDVLWERGPFQLMGEAVVEDGARRRDDQAGLYLQGVAEVLPRLHLVGRYEHYERRESGPPNNLFIGGVAYKPRPWLVLKAEYLAADHRAEESPSGFKSSIAILF